jgi:hypothetical protein
VLLPRYTGDNRTVYRGESVDRWLRRNCGFAWSSRIEVARDFARVLNAIEPDGGVLLSTLAPANSIIAGPSEHSQGLGEDEYVIDRRKLVEVVYIETFPAVWGNRSGLPSRDSSDDH